MDGDHGTKWNHGQVKIGALVNFKVAFKGVKNYQWNWKYTGLDDISFISCQAPQDLGPGECHFESGMCGYRDEQVYDDFDWVRHKGETQKYVVDFTIHSISYHSSGKRSAYNYR